MAIASQGTITPVQNGFILDLSLTHGREQRVFRSLEEALAELAWYVGKFTPGEIDRVKIITKKPEGGA